MLLSNDNDDHHDGYSPSHQRTAIWASLTIAEIPFPAIHADRTVLSLYPHYLEVRVTPTMFSLFLYFKDIHELILLPEESAVEVHTGGESDRIYIIRGELPHVAMMLYDLMLPLVGTPVAEVALQPAEDPSVPLLEDRCELGLSVPRSSVRSGAMALAKSPKQPLRHPYQLLSRQMLQMAGFRELGPSAAMRSPSRRTNPGEELGAAWGGSRVKPWMDTEVSVAEPLSEAEDHGSSTTPQSYDEYAGRSHRQLKSRGPSYASSMPHSDAFVRSRRPSVGLLADRPQMNPSSIRSNSLGPMTRSEARDPFDRHAKHRRLPRASRFEAESDITQPHNAYRSQRIGPNPYVPSDLTRKGRPNHAALETARGPEVEGPRTAPVKGKIDTTHRASSASSFSGPDGTSPVKPLMADFDEVDSDSPTPAKDQDGKRMPNGRAGGGRSRSTSFNRSSISSRSVSSGAGPTSNAEEGEGILLLSYTVEVQSVTSDDGDGGAAVRGLTKRPRSHGSAPANVNNVNGSTPWRSARSSDASPHDVLHTSRGAQNGSRGRLSPKPSARGRPPDRAVAQVPRVEVPVASDASEEFTDSITDLEAAEVTQPWSRPAAPGATARPTELAPRQSDRGSQASSRAASPSGSLWRQLRSLHDGQARVEHELSQLRIAAAANSRTTSPAFWMASVSQGRRSPSVVSTENRIYDLHIEYGQTFTS